MRSIPNRLKQVALLAIVAFALILAGRWYVVRKLSGAGGSRAGLQSVLMKLEADRQIVSSRVNAVTEASLRRNLSEAEEVFELMGDADLNRLALLYMGADWSTPRNAFQGRIRGLQNRGRNQMDERTRRAVRCKRTLDRLERRRRLLKMSLGAPSTARKTNQELSDVERQISALKSSKDYVELVAPNAVEGINASEQARVDEEISLFAAEYRRDSVERLEGVIRDRLVEQQDELSKLERRQRLLSWLDFWPLTTLIPSAAEK